MSLSLFAIGPLGLGDAGIKDLTCHLALASNETPVTADGVALAFSPCSSQLGPLFESLESPRIDDSVGFGVEIGCLIVWALDYHLLPYSAGRRYLRVE